MGITNGQPVDETYTNPAFIDRRQDDTAFGKYTLNNTTDPNSGPVVTGVQEHINNVWQDRKIFAHTATYQKVSYLTGTLSCPENVVIRSRDYAVNNTILAANFPLVFSDGDSAYVTLSRYLSANVTPVITASLPKGKDIFRLCTRIGSGLVFYDGSILLSGQSGVIGNGASGVETLAIFGDVTRLVGDVDIEAGTNVTLSRSGQRIKIDVASGGGSVIDSSGNVDIQLKPQLLHTFILVSPDATQWRVDVANDGTLSVVSGVGGAPSNIKVTKPDASEASLAITNLGELQVVSPPAGGETLNNVFYVASPDGTAWRLTITNLNEIQFESDTTGANYWRVRSDTGQVLAQIQEVGGLATHYVPVFTAATLPSSPTAITSCLPWVFYDSGTFKRPIYNDGTNWRYFHDNSIV